MQCLCFIVLDAAARSSISFDQASTLAQYALEQFRQLEAVAKGSPQQVIEENARRYGLTKREMEIVQLICKGHSYPQIASKLYISDRTVGKHVENIFEKAAVRNKVELTHKLLGIESARATPPFFRFTISPSDKTEENP